MKDEKSLVRSSSAEYLTYIASTGDGGVNAIYADENIWLTQKMMGVLYNVETHTINYHLKKIFSDSELEENSVVRNFRITAADGKLYNTKHYNLSAIIAATDREILINAGKVTAEIAKAYAESEFQKYRIIQDQLFESDFDREINRLNENND
ncbi:MAG: hypothetical protein WCR38_06955 [Bacteroidales bacterium]